MPDRPVKVVPGGPAFYVKEPPPKDVPPAVKGKATKRRKAWEASPEGQQRMAAPAAMSGPGAGAPGMARETYRHMGWGDTDITPHPEDQMALPGMGSLQEGRAAGLVRDGRTTLPDTVETPRWHHLSGGEKMNVEAHAASFGVTRASAKAAYAANLDQSYDTAHAAGYRPHAEEFYNDTEPHMPRGKVLAAAKATDSTVSEIVTGTAITSPKTKWGPVRAAGQEGRYPNIRAAEHAAAHAGQPAAAIPSAQYEDGGNVSVMHGNVTRAADAIHQQKTGTLAADLRTPAGNPIFGGPTQQKTTPFGNAFKDPFGPRAMLTSDIHTGYRGFAPHLGTSEGEAYLDHPGLKSWHDDIAREVHRERGIQSVNVGQAAQWGQAQLDSGEVKHDVAFPKEGPGPTTTAKPRPGFTPAHAPDPNQLSMQFR